MRLEKLEIKNYKLFNHVVFTPQKDITLLMGTNGSGKSALFQVFRFLGGLARGSDFRDMHMWFSLFAPEGFIGCLPKHDKSKIMTFRINAVDEDVKYQYILALGVGSNEQPRIVKEELVINETPWIWWDVDEHKWIFKDDEVLARGYDYPLILNSSTERFILLSKKYEDEGEIVQRFIHWMNGWGDYTLTTINFDNYIKNMDYQMLAYRSGDYSSILSNWKNSGDNDRWEFVCEYMNTFLSVLNLDLKFGLKTTIFDNFYMAESKLYSTIDKLESGYNLTDGLKQLLIILITVCFPNISLLTLEEPEQHIDPRIFNLIVEAIQTAVEQWPRQIVLIAQSPIFASHWPIESIRLIKNGTINLVSKNLCKEIEENRLQFLDAWMMDMLIGEFQA